MAAALPAPAASERVQTAIWVGAIVLTLAGVLFMLALLRQRDGSDPWSRVDVYTGGFIVVAGLSGIAQATTFLRSGVRSASGAGEAFGLSYDPGVVLFVAILQLGNVAVILDYGHWHLLPALEQPALRTIGLVLAVAGSAGLAWSDVWLARHFANAAAAAELMTGGPYHFVRHPRYASALVLMLGSVLVFASILGWPLWLLALATIRRRIEREEPHLRVMFGDAYDAYASRTPRLLPGVY